VGLFYLLAVATHMTINFILNATGIAGGEEWTYSNFILGESKIIAALVVAAGVMSRIERTAVASFGVGLRTLLCRPLWRGFLFGLLVISLATLLIWAGGGYRISGLNFSSWVSLLKSTIGWFVAFLAVGVGEELFFRGYALHRMTSDLGFWAAALISSSAFSALHYFTKPMENFADATMMFLTGLFLASSVRVTGDLRFAIGFHTAVDYGGIFVVGAPNTGNAGLPLADRFSESTFNGPAWLTGGPLGIQSSAMSALALFVVVVLCFWHRRATIYARLFLNAI
jgi:membrane protease YdiL (CAAX protease family)